MALIDCPGCNHNISDIAVLCPKCGFVLQSDPEQSKYKEFFSVSTLKFILMCLGTLNIYQIYWAYKNFWVIKKATGKNIWPFWRAIFLYLISYTLFKPMNEECIKYDTKKRFNPKGYAILFIILVISSSFLGFYRFGDEATPTYTSLDIFLLAIPLFLLAKVNIVLVELNERKNSKFKNNDEFSAWNWLAVIFGILYWGFVLIGVFFTDLLY